MDRQAIGTTVDGRSRLLHHQILMTSLKLFRKRRQQLHARDLRCLVAFYFCPLEEKIVNNRVFRLFLRCTILGPDKHAELIKVYFKPLVRKLNFSTFVRFQYTWEKNNPS